ncbi:MAG: HlyC/CorC family transporter [Planctomycetota bacterium]|nr:MAG: HlyC/CorC family transporter [Planctomycetota bacterium]REJ87107.1 MAG: HlyC/CorC family transporter [Planctomycetota bacterium]
MPVEAFFWIAIASLAATCLASIGARSLREFDRHELEELRRARPNGPEFGEILQHHDHVAVGIESLHVVTSALFVVATTLWWFAGADLGWGNVASCAGTVALGLLTFNIWLPWAIVRIWASPFLYRTWRFWRGINRLLAPLTLLARLVDVLVHRLAGRQPTTPSEDMIEEEIRTIVSEGHREGLLEEDAREMIEGVMELGDADVAKIMTPRTEMITLSVDVPWPEVVDFVIHAGHTRIPVYDKTRDDILGVLYAKDLLPVLKDGLDKTASPLRSILREPYFVPETKHLDDLLEEFQQTRNHMALVLDEYGGVSGLVTIEDVLEEIVGEIVDEYDEELVEEIRQLDETTYEVLARVHVDELNDRFDLGLPVDGDYDTVGGFVFSQLGHVPAAGEELVWNGARIKVSEASRRRIEKLRMMLPQLRRETA